MAAVSFSKINIFAFLTIITQQLADTATNYITNSAETTNESSQPSIYAEYPQEYYIPQTYQKYTPQPENQIQTAVGYTEKTLLSHGYKIPISATKYIASQVAKPPQATYSNQGSTPYLYTVARVVPPTVTYESQVDAGNKYEEAPKKYHYGYRVSNPYTGTEFGHSEVNDGLTAKGYYHVLLPDGRLQNVKYWAGPSGYHATITYDTKY